MFRSIIAVILRWESKRVLAKYHPTVVGITGSVGKTSTKEAVRVVLASKYQIRVTQGNFNTEVGVPLTILGLPTAGRNIFGWFKIFSQGLGIIWGKASYPQVLILEMAADKPGDLEYLTSFIHSDVAVVTAAGISHLSQFGTREAVIKEKSALVKNMRPEGVAILNYDNDGSRFMMNLAAGKFATYGSTPDADWQYLNVQMLKVEDADLYKMSFLVKSPAGNTEVSLKSALGEPMVAAATAALAVGHSLGVSLSEAARALEDFASAPGRLKLIPSFTGAVILDDSYNAAPDSTLAALKLLEQLEGQTKYVVLGKMAELGQESENGHRKVGKIISLSKVQAILKKSPETDWIADELNRDKFSAERLHQFDSDGEIVAYLQGNLKQGDVVLFKGSRSEHLEEIIKQIMAMPEKADRLLVHG